MNGEGGAAPQNVVKQIIGHVEQIAMGVSMAIAGAIALRGIFLILRTKRGDPTFEETPPQP